MVWQTIHTRSRVIGDGMADNPVQSLGGLTPLEKANIPTIDRWQRHGELGSVRNVPEGFPPGSDTAIMSILVVHRQNAILVEHHWSGGTGHCSQARGCCVPLQPYFGSDADCPFEEKKLLSHSGGQIEGKNQKN